MSLSITFETHLPKIFRWVHIAALSAIIRILKEATKAQSNEKFIHNIARTDEEAANGNFKRHLGKLEEFKYKNGYNEFIKTHPNIAQPNSNAQLNYPSTNAKP